MPVGDVRPLACAGEPGPAPRGFWYLSGADLERVDPGATTVIAWAEAAFAAQGAGRVRNHKILMAGHGGGRLISLVGVAPDAGAQGSKWVTYYPGNAPRGLPDSTAILVLNDFETGGVQAIMEGMWPTFARTAAMAAVAVRHLARSGRVQLRDLRVRGHSRLLERRRTPVTVQARTGWREGRREGTGRRDGAGDPWSAAMQACVT